MRDIPATCDCPFRSGTIQPTVDTAAPVTAQTTGSITVERLAVRPYELPDSSHVLLPRKAYPAPLPPAAASSQGIIVQIRR
jgi:hypothetical protein